MAASSAALRRRLVLQLERRGSIATPAVREAFLSVPRELFLRQQRARLGLEAIYRDEAILTRRGPRGQPLSSSSQPTMMALMLERLALTPGARVLEIGAGTGYNAALIAAIVAPRGRVSSLELDVATAAEAREALRAGGYDVRVVVGDGRHGLADGAPYDRIVVTASTAQVERSWHDQLVPGGLLQVPLWIRGPELQLVATLRRDEDCFRSLSTITGAFMPLRDSENEPQSLASGGGPLPLRGPALERMGEEERERLLSLLEGAPRVRPVEPATAWRLWFFLRAATPSRLLAFGSLGAGVATPDGSSLALLEGGRLPEWGFAGRRTAIHSYGTDEAERRLLDLVERWRARGRPGDGDLALEVRFENGGSRLRRRWRRPA
jgi:protein-L-isoaspartate(D-aspartate) O-methyltransferase